MQKTVDVVQIAPHLYLDVAEYKKFWEKLKLMAKSEAGWELLAKYRNAEYLGKGVAISEDEESTLTVLGWGEYSSYPVDDIVRLCLRASYDYEDEFYLNLTDPKGEVIDESYARIDEMDTHTLQQGIISLSINTDEDNS